MIILREDVITYTKDELYDLVRDNSELNDFSQELICQFIDKCSVQLAGIEHQMTRQPLITKSYNDFFKLKSEFVKLVNWLIDTKIESQGQLDKSLDSFLGKVKEFIESVEMFVSTGTVNLLNKHYDNLEVYLSKFKTDSTGLIEDNETKSISNNLLQINEFNSNDNILDMNDSDTSDIRPKPIKKFRLMKK